jgi:hypothetical protein
MWKSVWYILIMSDYGGKLEPCRSIYAAYEPFSLHTVCEHHIGQSMLR